MKIITLIFMFNILINPIDLNAEAAKAKTLYLRKKKSVEKIVLHTREGVTLNESCWKNILNCKAKKAQLKKAFKQPSSTDKEGMTISESSQRCQQSGGRSKLLMDTKLNQFEYCTYDDGSYIPTKQLF